MNLENLTDQVCELAKKAGAYMRAEKEKFAQLNIEVKDVNNFVTHVDKNSEKLIVERLQELLPESGFIAEEGTSTKIGDEYNWIIDPLDGTTNYIHGIPCFAVSIALKQNNEIVLGVIYEVNFDECFYAWKGSAAYLNGKIIKVSKAATLKDSLLATGFPYYKYQKLVEYLHLFKHFMQHTHGLRRLGSAATDMAYVACGRFDGFYEYSLQPWDVAAGIIIVKQAGGSVCDFRGGDNYLFGEEIIVSNNKIFEEFKGVVNEYMNK